MKNVTLKILAVLSIILSLQACNKADDLADNLEDQLSKSINQYQINMNGELYEEGESIVCGIAQDVTHEEAMIAGVAPTINIAFEVKNYKAGKVLKVGLEEENNVEAIVLGSLILNKDTDAESFLTYVAKSGTATLVSKKRMEFNLVCYSIEDITDEGDVISGANSFTLTGFITENDPME